MKGALRERPFFCSARQASEVVACSASATLERLVSVQRLDVASERAEIGALDMAAYYLIVDVRIDDADEYKKYMLGAKPIAERHGGEYLVRGGEFQVVEGDYYQPRRLVVIRFPSKAAFESFYHSPDYQQVRQIRLPVSDMVMVGVEGSE